MLVLLTASRQSTELTWQIHIAMCTVLRLLMMDSRSVWNMQNSLSNKFEKYCILLAFIISMNGVLNLLCHRGSKTWTQQKLTAVDVKIWDDVSCAIYIVIPRMVPRQSGCIPIGPFPVMIISHGCQWHIAKTQCCV
jgi:hypothetical protein